MWKLEREILNVELIKSKANTKLSPFVDEKLV